MEILALVLLLVVLIITVVAVWTMALMGIFGEYPQTFALFAAMGMFIVIVTAVPLGLAAFLFATAARLLLRT